MEEKARLISEESEKRELETKQLTEQLEQAKKARQLQLRKLSALGTPDVLHIRDTHGETDDVSPTHSIKILIIASFRICK